MKSNRRALEAVHGDGLFFTSEFFGLGIVVFQPIRMMITLWNEGFTKQTTTNLLQNRNGMLVTIPDDAVAAVVHFYGKNEYDLDVRMY